jgi:hypothetical protein
MNFLLALEDGNIMQHCGAAELAKAFYPSAGQGAKTEQGNNSCRRDPINSIPAGMRRTISLIPIPVN